jgi:hypothetical protein
MQPVKMVSCEKKVQKLPISRENILKLPYLNNTTVPVGSPYSQILKKILLSFFINSQIWIIPLVDDQQCSYITKLRKPCYTSHKNLDIHRVNLELMINI